MGKRVVSNSIFSMVQVVLGGLVMFILYGYLTRRLGYSIVGIWALIMSTTAVSRVGEFGLASGLVRFIAAYRAQDRHDDIRLSLHTSLIVMTGGVLVLGVIIFCIAWIALPAFVSPGEIHIARYFLWFAMISFIFNAVVAVFQGVVEGCQRYDIFSILHLLASVVHLIGVVTLVPFFDYRGLAYSQLIQTGFLVITMSMAANRLIPDLQWTRLRFSMPHFKQLFSFGIAVQGIFVCHLLFEVLAKGLLGYFGNTAWVGVFEIASKFLLRLRQIFASAIQVTLPFISEKDITAPDEIPGLYARHFPVFILSAMGLFTGLACVAPILSWIIDGAVNTRFIITLMAGCIGWGINTLALPAFYVCLGQGWTRPPVTANTVMLVCLLILGPAAGWGFGYPGIILAWVVSLTLGGMRLLVPVHARPGFSKRSRANRMARVLVVFWIGMLVAAIALMQGFPGPGIPGVSLTLSIVFVVSGSLIWLPACGLRQDLAGILKTVRGG
jgi:O-antigen/teichoic acid export membrane protein